MKVLSTNIYKTFTIKKSKFLCFGFFVKNKDEVKTFINDLKKQYPDASHICYAYILDDNTYYYTDAGEPSGTAGKPIYGTLLSTHLNYTLFVVIRYFGGIKFGPGPLRSTFKDVSMETLSNAKFKEAIISDVVIVNVPYSDVKKIDASLKNFLLTKEFKKEYVQLNIFANEELVIPILKRLNVFPVMIKKQEISFI